MTRDKQGGAAYPVGVGQEVGQVGRLVAVRRCGFAGPAHAVARKLARLLDRSACRLVLGQELPATSGCVRRETSFVVEPCDKENRTTST